MGYKIVILTQEASIVYQHKIAILHSRVKMSRNDKQNKSRMTKKVGTC